MDCFFHQKLSNTRFTLKFKGQKKIVSRDGKEKKLPRELKWIENGKEVVVRSDTNPYRSAPLLFNRLWEMNGEVKKANEALFFLDNRTKQLESMVLNLNKTVIQMTGIVEEIKEENENLKKEVEFRKEEAQAWKEEAKRLGSMLNLDSHNSGKPPSTDTFRKKKTPVKNSREKSGKKAGGQEGHKGTTLRQVENPHEIVLHELNECPGCGHGIADVPIFSITKRQSFDFPPIKLIATERQAQTKICPFCGETHRAEFPYWVTSQAVYGPNIMALNVYLDAYQLIPCKRKGDFFEDWLGHRVSQGFLKNGMRSCYENLEAFEKETLEALKASEVVGVDSTGVSCVNESYNLHVACTDALTYYTVHKTKSMEDFESGGFLSVYQGILVHDCYSSYFNYGAFHGLCGAHNLRDCIFAYEEEGKQWAKRMIKLLKGALRAVERAKAAGKTFLETGKLATIRRVYDDILEEGLSEYPEVKAPPDAKKRRGRRKQSKSKNFLDRLQNYADYALAFCFDFRVPFTNNQSERDVRMMKLKDKISGTFRTEEGAKIFCRIRGYISTMIKQGKNVFEALKMAVQGQPIMPEKKRA